MKIPSLFPVRRIVPAVVTAIGMLAPGVLAQSLTFTPPSFLPGDSADGIADGHQEDIDIAAGGDRFLAVWSDGRSSLDDFQGLTGSGYDVYGALLDADGNVLLRSIVIDEGPGNQIKPHVAWNGEAWLVAWIEQDPVGSPTYDRIRAVRVAADGTVVDSSPILIQEDDYFFSFEGMAMAGGGTDGWTVVFEGNGTGLRAVRVAPDGTVATPGGGLLITSANVTDFDITFATDQYLVIHKNASGVCRARRYSPTLQSLGNKVIPFADEVSTDGTNFLVVDTNTALWPESLQALRLSQTANPIGAPFTVRTGTAVSGPSGEGVGFDGTNYIVTWNTSSAARVTPLGVLLDPEGFDYSPVTTTFSKPAYDTAPGGGLQFLWHDGGGGAGYPKDAWTGRFTTSGVLTNQIPASVAAPAQVGPRLTRGPAGTNMIVFRSRTSGAARILAQRIDDQGMALDAEPIEVASGPVQWLTTPTIDDPDVAWNGSVFLVTWSDTIHVFARRMNPDGTFVDASPIVVMTGQSSSVGALGSNFLVSGSTVGTLLAIGSLRVARVDGNTGAVLDGSPTTLTTAGGRFPHIVSLGGRWLVVWENVSGDPWSTSVFVSTGAAFVEPDGTTAGDLGVGLGPHPSVAVSDDRALFVAVDGTLSSATTDLEGRIMMADGSFLGPVFPISTAADKQLAPAAAWNGTEFIAAWEDLRNSVAYFDERTDIYGARVSPGGVVLDPLGVPLAESSHTEAAPEFLSLGSTTLLATSIVRSDTSLGTYRVGLQRSDGTPFVCQTDIGFGGPGGASLQMCGQALATGATSSLLLTGGPPLAPTWVAVSPTLSPTPFFGGLLAPVPPTLILPFVTDAFGQIVRPGITGGGGPMTMYVQAVLLDGSLPLGLGFSNALEIDFLP